MTISNNKKVLNFSKTFKLTLIGFPIGFSYSFPFQSVLEVYFYLSIKPSSKKKNTHGKKQKTTKNAATQQATTQQATIFTNISVPLRLFLW